MKKNILSMMSAALLVVGLAACGNKNAANTEDNNKVESEESAATEQVEEQEDRYAYLIPDSTGLFGMIPVHTFFAQWEITENINSYIDGEKVWRRHWEMVNEDFEAVKGNTIPTEVEEGLAVTVVEPFTIIGISGSDVYKNSIYVNLSIQTVIKVDSSVDPKNLRLLGYDKGHNLVWESRFNSNISDSNKAYASINFRGGFNAGYLSKLELIELTNDGADYYKSDNLNKILNKKERTYEYDLKMMHDSRKGQYTFDYGE